MPPPTSAELERWRRLVEEAQHQAGRPRRDPRQLVRAARACRDTILPFGGATEADRLFHRLKGEAERQAGWTAVERELGARDLGRLATEAAELLAQAGPGRVPRPVGGPSTSAGRPNARWPSSGLHPTPRFRADIDG